MLKGLDVDFEIEVKDTDESWPSELKGGAIPEYIAKKKSMAFGDLDPETILLTADTTVWIDGAAVNKPQDAQQAREMIGQLSGRTHHVYTGVCLRTADVTETFYDETAVVFRSLSAEQIAYYVEAYSPMDKAGAYGAQDWIGYVGIERIEGCYYNVMGLPVREVYRRLMEIGEGG